MILGCLLWIILTAMILGCSWALTCGLIYLIAWCFGLFFSLRMATGIWIVLIILGSIFTDRSKK